MPATSPEPDEDNDTASRLSDGEREEQGASCEASGGCASSRVPALSPAAAEGNDAASRLPGGERQQQ